MKFSFEMHLDTLGSLNKYEQYMLNDDPSKTASDVTRTFKKKTIFLYNRFCFSFTNGEKRN